MRRIFMFVLGIFMAIGFTLHPLSANADTNKAPQNPDGAGRGWCDGKWQLRGDLWAHNSKYTAVVISHLATFFVPTRLHETSMNAYFYCVQPGPNKIMSKWVEDCWAFAKNQEEHFTFAGVLAKTRSVDSSDRWSDSGGHLIDEVNGRQHCERDDIPEAEEMPMRLERDPRWRHSTQIRQRGPDSDWHYWKTSGGGVWKFYHPRDDIRLGTWHGYN